MKKIFSIFICSAYFLSMQVCFAANNLYFVKNTQKNTVSNIIDTTFAKNKNYTVTKRNPYIAVSKKNSNDYVLIILQQSSANLFYYFQSSSDEKTDKEIKKLLKKQNIIFEQSYNTMYLSTFENQAQKILTNTNSTYTFDEPKTQSTAYTQKAQKTDNTVLRGYVGQVSKGATFNAYLQTPINTATANINDNIIAVLTEDWTYNGHVIAPQGSIVNGVLTKARHAAYGSRNGRVVIDFTQVVTPENKTYEISTEKIDFAITNEGKIQKTVSSALTGAVIGALGGLLVGLLSKDANVGISTAIGAGVGAGTSLAGSAVEKGVDAEIPVYTELEITLTKPLSVVVGL